jgi:hypothetical protein
VLNALVPVEAHVVGSHAVLERRSPGAGIVALRRLDLQHVGTMVSEDLAAVRPAQDAGYVEHANAGKRAGTC